MTGDDTSVPATGESPGGRRTGPAGSAARPPVPGALELAPFRALRYTAAAGDLTALLSPPYDVIDEARRTQLEARSPFNAVRVVLPRGGDEGATDDRYAHAARLLSAWTADGVVAADPTAALHVYEESVDGHVQRGLVGALRLAPLDAGVVLPHENTMAGPVSDRLALMRATAANLEPIFCVYDGRPADTGGPTPAAAEAVAAVGGREPDVDVLAAEGVRHRTWALRDPEQLAAIAADLAARTATIADGHHRYTTYLALQSEHWARGEGSGPWDLGLTYLVDGTAFGPQVHAIHRYVTDLSLEEAARRAAGDFRTRESSLEEALAALGAGAAPDAGAVPDAGVEEAPGATAVGSAETVGFLAALTDGERTVLLDLPGQAVRAVADDPARSRAWASLDVTLAHRGLIAHTWGLDDAEDRVRFAHDVSEAVEGARATAGVALLLRPTPVEQVAAVAAAGDRMPRKSTLFVPKPATGLFLRTFAAG